MQVGAHDAEAQELGLVAGRGLLEDEVNGGPAEPTLEPGLGALGLERDVVKGVDVLDARWSGHDCPPWLCARVPERG